VVVASQPGRAAGSRRFLSFSTSSSHTLWPTSSASSRFSRCRAQIDHTSGEYRSTICSQAARLPAAAWFTSAITDGSSRTAHPLDNAAHRTHRRTAGGHSSSRGLRRRVVIHDRNAELPHDRNGPIGRHVTEQAGDRGLGLLPGMIGFLAGPSAAAALADPLRPLALIPKYAETMATTGAEIAPITATAP